MSRRADPLRRRAMRTAAAATAAVAALLLVTLAVTDLVVARNLTAGVDDQLRERMAVPSPVATSPGRDSPDDDLDEPVVQWRVASDGTVQAATGIPQLPAGMRAVTTPISTPFDGGTFRFAGTAEPDGAHLVVAASLYPVTHAVDTLLITEGLAVPVVLLMILAGAFIVGRRVAGPIERMRQRQLAFTADASHELRTPLSVIRAETSLARHGTGAEAKTSLAKVEAEADRMRRIVDDLLWLARFQVEPDRSEHSAVDLAAAVEVAVTRFAAVAHRRSIVLEAEVPAQGAVLIVAPPDWIDHALGILIDNACRYTPAHGRVTVSAECRDGRAELAVRDSGQGVPPAELDHLFDRYRRATTEGDGAGLGLAIADAIVRATGGRWNVTNQPEGGARFAISWSAGR